MLFREIQKYLKNKRIKRFISNASWLYILQIIMYIFPLITFPYMTHILQPELFGIYTYVIAVMTYFQIFWDFGFTLSATRSCAENSGDKSRLSEIVSAVILLKSGLLLFGVLILPLLVIYSYVLNRYQLFLYAMYFAFGINVFLPDYLFRGVEKMRVFVIRNLITKVLFTGLLLILVRESSDFYWIPFIFFFTNSISVLWSFFLLSSELGVKLQWPSLKVLSGEFRTSLGYFISRIATTASDSLNTILIGSYFSATTIGIFGVANSLKNVLCSACSPIADALFPYTVKTKNFRLIRKILIYLVPVAMVGCIALYFCADMIISILCGSQYLEAVPYFQMFLYVVCITLPIYILGYPALCAMDKANQANLSVIYAGIFQICGLLLLSFLNQFTISNVVLLTMATNTITLLLRMYYCKSILFFFHKDVNLHAN